MASSFQNGLNEALHNGVCDASRRAVVGGLIFAGLTAETLAGAAAGLAASAAGALTYASFCGTPLPPEYQPNPPFNGGQCGGVTYRIITRQTYTDNRNGQTGEQMQDHFVTGAITRIEFVVLPNSLNQTNLIIQAQAGSVLEVPNPAQSDDGINPRYSFSNFRTEVGRPDGLADSCGSPPATAPPIPPGNNDHNDTITYNDNSGNTFNVPVTIRYGFGNVGINGTLNVPVTINFGGGGLPPVGGDLNLTNNHFTVNFGGDNSSPLGGDGEGGGDVIIPPGAPAPPPATLPLPAPGTPPLPPGSPLPPTSPPAPPVPPNADPAASKRKIMRGAMVTTLLIGSEVSQIFQQSNPDILVPALGYISFLIQIGQRTAWTTDIPVKNTRQIIQCPWDLGAIDVKGTARGNGSFQITPIYTTLTYNPRFPPET